MRMADLQPGWRVMSNDGQQFGTVKEVGQNYLVVSKSMFSSNVHVPASAIANVENDRVYLNHSKREAEQMGWGDAPRGDDEPETAEESDLHRHV